MAETVLEHWDGNNDRFTVCTEERKYKNLLSRLAESHPESVECVAQNADGSVVYHVPANWVHIRPPKRSNMTPEQRAAAAERLREYRQAQTAIT